MNKQEIKDLKKHGYDPKKLIEPNGQILNGLIIMSNGSKELHDSGYPYIRVYGIAKDGLVDLGWHDHYVCNVPVNIDSFGKNIFHLFLWSSGDRVLKVIDNFSCCSSLLIGDMYSKDEKFIYVD